MGTIKSKADWYRYFKAGIFNCTQTYSIDNFIHDFDKIADGQFMVRDMEQTGSSLKLGNKMDIINFLKYKRSNKYIISERAPDETLIVQGEYDGIDATISFEKTHMRKALKEKSFYVSRLQLLDIVGSEVYNQLNEYLEMFQENDIQERQSVIEFSLFGVPVGIYREHLIIWEIRSY